MNYILFLDDERLPTNPRNYTSVSDGVPPMVVIARTFADFKWYVVYYGLPIFITFDHDLGRAQTGMDCARFVVDYCLDNNLAPDFEFYVHSQNPVGKENISKLLNNFKKQFDPIPSYQ